MQAMQLMDDLFFVIFSDTLSSFPNLWESSLNVHSNPLFLIFHNFKYYLWWERPLGPEKNAESI